MQPSERDHSSEPEAPAASAPADGSLGKAVIGLAAAGAISWLLGKWLQQAPEHYESRDYKRIRDVPEHIHGPGPGSAYDPGRADAAEQELRAKAKAQADAAIIMAGRWPNGVKIKTH